MIVITLEDLKSLIETLPEPLPVGTRIRALPPSQVEWPPIVSDSKDIEHLEFEAIFWNRPGPVNRANYRWMLITPAKVLL